MLNSKIFFNFTLRSKIRGKRRKGESFVVDDKGEIVSSYDVDENIALQIWTKGLSPRLVVVNKNQNSRKLIRLGWLEKQDRKLSVKGKKRGQSVEYALSDLLPAAVRILSEYAVYTAFKPRLWKFAVVLEKALHTPALITDRGEFSLLPEDKRTHLWIADLTGEKKGEGFFRPFFPLAEQERQVFSEEGIPITENKRGVDDLFKTGVVRKLASENPLRWYNPVRAMAAAILLGFSYCGADSSDWADDFWREESPQNPAPLKDTDPRLGGLGQKYAAFARHFSALSRIETRTSLDSDKELQGEEYTRKRRIEFPAPLLGDVGYSVTFFEREDGSMALGAKPRATTARHQGELVYLLTTEIYEQALFHDSLGGASDDYFTVSQLVSAKNFEAWTSQILPYVAPFAGLS